MAVNAKYGTRIKRREDPTLIQGQGRYSDDIKLPGMLSCAFVRAGVAHGTITNVEHEAASDAWCRGGLHGRRPQAERPSQRRPAGSHARGDAPPVLATDKVRFIGEPIAVVVAETHAQAVDAVELVEVDIDELPVLVDMTKALEDGAPILFERRARTSPPTAPLGAPARSTTPRSRSPAGFVNQRLAAVPMEPAAAVAAPDPEIGGVRLWAPQQGPHMGQGAISPARWTWSRRRSVSSVPAVGGGFGARIATTPSRSRWPRSRSSSTSPSATSRAARRP